MAILDTTVLVDLINGAKGGKRKHYDVAERLDELKSRGEKLRITPFSIGELYVGVARCASPGVEASHVESVTSRFSVVMFTPQTARLWGVIMGDLQAAGMAIETVDAMIASVAIQRKELLLTRNPRHFARVPQLVMQAYS